MAPRAIGLGLGEVVIRAVAPRAELSAKQVSAAVGIAGHVVSSRLVAGFGNGAVCCDGGHARGDDGITAQRIGFIGGSSVFYEELYIAIGNRHIEGTGHLVVRHGVVKRCREIIGVPGFVEHEVRTAGRYSRIVAEGQEYGPHRS